MSLSMMSVGESGRIIEFRGKDSMKRHLQDIGFIKGEKIEVVGENQSCFILLVKGVKIALNRGLASLIVVN